MPQRPLSISNAIHGNRLASRFVIAGELTKEVGAVDHPRVQGEEAPSDFAGRRAYDRTGRTRDYDGHLCFAAATEGGWRWTGGLLRVSCGSPMWHVV